MHLFFNFWVPTVQASMETRLFRYQVVACRISSSLDSRLLLDAFLSDDWSKVSGDPAKLMCGTRRKQVPKTSEGGLPQIELTP